MKRIVPMIMAMAVVAVVAGCSSPRLYFADRRRDAADLFTALGRTLRFGFNPGELLDFILGWFTIDIYGDDLG